MSDYQALKIDGGILRNIALADRVKAGGMYYSGGTISLEGTAVSLPNSTNLTGSGTGALSGFASIEGITSANLVDKSASETITGQWLYQAANTINPKLIVKMAGGEAADSIIFQVQDAAGANLFSVDGEGDVVVQGAETIVGGMTFQGNVTFGNATTDTVEFVSRVKGGTDLIPETDSTSDLGTNLLRYQTLFVDSIGDTGQALTIASNGVTVNQGGIGITAGGLAVTAGGVSVTAGGATITAGGISVVSGGIKTSIANKTAAYPITDADHIITCASAGAGFDITLPAVSGRTGKQFIVKRKASDATADVIRVVTTGGELVDNNTSVTLVAGDSITAVCDGTEWHIV